MKKLIALLLIAALTLCLAACGKTVDPKEAVDQALAEAAADTRPAETEAPVTQAPETKAPETEAPETEAPDTEAPETEAPETEAPAQEDEISLGVVDGSTYTNETLGITCTVDGDWTFLDKEMIAQVNQTTLAMFNDESIRKLLSEGGSYIDAYANSQTTGSNFNISMQKVGIATSLLTTERDVLENAKAQAVTAMESAGFTDVEYTIDSMTFAGEEHVVGRISSKLNNVELSQVQVCLIKNGYCGIITATCTAVIEFDKIFGFFAKIE